MPGFPIKHAQIARAEKPKFCLFNCDDASTTAATTTSIATATTTSATDATSTTTTTSATDTTTTDLGLSLSIPNPLSTTTTSSTATTTTSSSTTTTLSSSTTSTTTSSTTTSTTSTPPPTASSTSTSFYVTSSDGQILTITSVFQVTASQAASSTTSDLNPSSTTTPTPFLQNKALAGSVFGIGGAMVLVVIISLVTMALRKSRKNRLEDEALSEQLPWPSADDEEKLRGEVPSSHRPVSMAGTSADGHGMDTPTQMYGVPAAYGGYGGPQAGYAPAAYPAYAPSTPAPQDGYYAQPQQWAAPYNHAAYGNQNASTGLYDVQPQQTRASQYSADGGPMVSPYEPIERHSAVTPGPSHDSHGHQGPTPY